MSLSLSADEMTLIDFSTSPQPNTATLSASRPNNASSSFPFVFSSSGRHSLLEDDQVTILDQPLSPVHKPDQHRSIWAPRPAQSTRSKSKGIGNSDSGFFESEEQALIDFDEKMDSSHFETGHSAIPDTVKDESTFRYIGKQKFVFHDIDDRPFMGFAESLPDNRVSVKGDDGDEEYIITYDPTEMERIEQNTWPDQSLKWRDKFTPKYSILRQNPRVVERYVPKYSKLARSTSKWRAGIYRCFDAEDEEEQAKDEEKYFTEIEAKAGSNSRDSNLESDKGMQVDNEETAVVSKRLHAIEIANLVPETLTEDVKVRLGSASDRYQLISLYVRSLSLSSAHLFSLSDCSAPIITHQGCWQSTMMNKQLTRRSDRQSLSLR